MDRFLFLRALSQRYPSSAGSLARHHEVTENQGQIRAVEIFLQWLDDIEDLMFSLLLTWERLRLRCLLIGLVAALILSVIRLVDVRAPLASTFAVAACASVAFWFTGLIGAQILRLYHESSHISSRSGA